MIGRWVAIALILTPVGASAILDGARPDPSVSSQTRPGVDRALQRTVTLVLRAEARSNGLPATMTDPAVLDAEQMAKLVVGARLPDEIEAVTVPPSLNRRLPHVRGESVWAVVGTALIEVDPVRLTILSVALDVLPPQL